MPLLRNTSGSAEARDRTLLHVPMAYMPTVRLSSSKMFIPPIVPPLDGSITAFPGLADFQSQHNPDSPWVVYPSRDSPTGAKTVSYKELCDATHRIAHAVRPERNGTEQEVVAVIIHTDALLYVTLLIGMIRAGIVVSISSLKQTSKLKISIHSRFPCPLVTLPKRYVTCWRVRAAVA